MMPISFVCSYKLALIEELNEKKQRNIVITITTSKSRDMIESTFSILSLYFDRKLIFFT